MPSRFFTPHIFCSLEPLLLDPRINQYQWLAHFTLVLISDRTIDWQLTVGWGTDSSNSEVLDFTGIPYTIIVFNSHLNYPRLIFLGNGIFSNLIILYF